MAIARVVRRYFGGIVCGLVAAIAYFQARGAPHRGGATLRGGASSSGSTTSPNEGRAPSETRKGQAVLERNPFDSVVRPVTERAGCVENDDATRAAASDPLSWPDCEGVRVSIVTQSSDPWWSLTTLQAPGEPRARLRRVGDSVAGKQVAFIGYNPKQLTPSVWLQGGGTFCQSALSRAQGPTVAPTATRPTPVAELNVARSVLEGGGVNTLSALRSVRVVPEQKDGMLIGLRLFGIRPGTLLGTLGLKNGDRLESINGFNVASPEKALEAYARLRTAKRLSVQLSRLGKPVNIDLNIN